MPLPDAAAKELISHVTPFLSVIRSTDNFRFRKVSKENLLFEPSKLFTVVEFTWPFEAAVGMSGFKNSEVVIANHRMEHSFFVFLFTTGMELSFSAQDSFSSNFPYTCSNVGIGYRGQFCDRCKDCVEDKPTLKAKATGRGAKAA